MQAQIIPKSQHSIDKSHIDPDAIKTIEALQSHGYTAYLVGGGVRDLLLGQSPKDYDISTSAKPEEVKGIFKRNCLMIGRRFRLAHVRFGRKIFEVSTFRSGDNDADHLIVRDNEWGTPEEDVLRRDFTINGLFYDLENESIIDYVGGFEDVKKRLLRSIGDPAKRFKQDPVRMMRLLKFMARLKFQPEEASIDALSKLTEEISKSAPARLLEEILRMLESGSSVPFFHLMVNYGILELLFPKISEFLNSPKKEEVFNLLRTVDQFHKQNSPKLLRRSVLASCLLYPLVDEAVRSKLLSKDENPHYGKVGSRIHLTLKDINLNSYVQFPKKLRASIDFIINAQYRFTPLHPKRKFKHAKFLSQPEISSALSFLSIRSKNEEIAEEKYPYWKQNYLSRSSKQPRKKQAGDE